MLYVENRSCTHQALLGWFDQVCTLQGKRNKEKRYRMGTHLQDTTAVRRSLEERDRLKVSSPDKPSMNRTGDPTMTTHRYLGFLLIILSALCFGAMPIFARFAYGAGADPI